MICAACHLTRDASDLIAFWPIGNPEARRFVCRPSCPSSAPGSESCFSRVVGPVNVHAIALASPTAELDPGQGRHWIAPATPAWSSLLAIAGVRGAVA
jgi:hypothetical protein